MKQINFKKLVPHLIAVAIFLLVTVIFCKPALEPGVVTQQSDVTAVESMKHQSDLYREKHGVYPLWISSMFSGMPAYNIIFDGPISPMMYINKVFQFGLPKPLNFFFLSCICFYIFCMCIRTRPYIAIMGSIAFAFATYNPILVVAGHDTKLLALAYAPALLGAILLLFNKKYLSGFVLTILFANLHLMQNHQQISYYLLLIIIILTLFFIAKWIKEKALVAGLKSIGLGLAAAVLAVMMNAVILFPVYDFAKYSKRGGQLVMDNKAKIKNDKISNNKTTGLSKDYAFQWSNDKMESFTLMFPGIEGYGSYFSQRDGEYSIFPKLDETSNVANFLMEKANLPEDKASEFAANLSGKVYWGGKPFTTGPAYVGAVICILFLIGLFMLDNKHKWWILTASTFGIILATGKYMPGINNFLFDYMPLYNKFRTPEMALVIPQLLFPIMAILTVEKIVDGAAIENIKKFKWGVAVVILLFAVVSALYFTLDYSNENKQRTNAINLAFATQDSSLNGKLQAINQQYEAESDNRTYEDILYQSKGDTQIAKGILNALKKDRESFFKNDIIRALIFSILTLSLIALFICSKINSSILTIGLIILVAADLLPFGMHYVNEKSFDAAEKFQASQFSPSAADLEIMEDKDPNFRVFNLAGGDPFQDSKPSYFHKSIGGYHPAKIGIYDDLATYQLSGQPNPAVLNMLNAKYIIQKSGDGKNEIAYPNPGALGNCWFVKGARFVNGPVEEMKALDELNPRDTAVIDNSFKAIVSGFVAADSNASIKQTAFDNMEITYQSNSNTANLAVFSEIFYKDWNAYIDGKQVPIAKANYVLRALVVPAGKHSIDFKFEPTVFNTSYTISMITNWLLLALLMWFGYYTYKKTGVKKELDAK